MDQHTAFENLKAAYVSKPVLLMPDRTKPYEIECDASLFATGAILLQQDTNGDWHPVAYHSKSMSPTERNYQVYDRELMAVICSLREWRCYIYGSDYTTIVWTDHHNLTYYTHPQKLTRRQVRWMVELMDYDIKLQHKAGSKMIVADALSRRADWSKGLEDDNDQVVALPDNLWIRLLDTELRDAVAKGLTNDSTAQEAMKRLSETEVSPTNWTLENSGQDSTTPFLFYNGRLYIPDEIDLRRQIVRDHHDTPTAGHPGVLATCRSIRTSYWWPGLSSFVRNYVTGCGVCQQFKVNTQPSKPSLVPIDALSSRIFGQVGIDFMMDLPESEGYDSIMVTVDHGLSKGVILTPCSKKGLTAEHTARLYIDNIYSRFGLPDKLISDRGPQFDSEFWKELCAALQIKHAMTTAMTTAWHSQTNGGTERVNREIQLFLSVFCINNPSSWVAALKKAEFVYNNRTHADRTQTPFELWYGQAPRAIPTAFDYLDYPKTKERLALLQQWRNDAHIAHEYTRQKMAEKIKSTFKPFLLGQQVWLEGRNLSIPYNKKITTKREGPFKIIEKMSSVNYKLKLPNKWNIHDTFHATLLSPYKETQVHGPNFTRPPPDLVDGEEEYEVDRILKDRRIRAKKGKWRIEYQVQWKGYEEPTWEPSENLSHAKDVILDYWTRKRKNNPDDNIACLILERGLTTDIHMVKLSTESLSRKPEL